MIGKVRLRGTVETPWLESKVLQGNLPGDHMERMLPVYLPPGYATSTERYPVIYVLSGHGSSGPLMLNSPAWGESFPERLDRLIVSGKVPPVIAVLPDCWTIFGGAQFINSSALGRYEDAPWFRSFCMRLLEGSPEVQRLLAHDPFEGRRPRYVRALLYRYRFADRATHQREGVWWTREALGQYSPVLSLEEHPRPQ